MRSFTKLPPIRQLKITTISRRTPPQRHGLAVVDKAAGMTQPGWAVVNDPPGPDDRLRRNPFLGSRDVAAPALPSDRKPPTRPLCSWPSLAMGESPRSLHTPSGVIQLIDPATGREFATLEPPDGQSSFFLSFSPDGSQLAATGNGNGDLHVWDLRLMTRRQLREMGLDWNLPRNTRPPTADASQPLRVEDHQGRAAGTGQGIDAGHRPSSVPGSMRNSGNSPRRWPTSSKLAQWRPDGNRGTHPAIS